LFFNIIVWSIVSAVWAALARWKSTITGTKIWPDVLASVGAAAVVIAYLVGIQLNWRRSSFVGLIMFLLMTC